MPADNTRVTRRAALAGLAALIASGCSKLSFLAANVPAAFGAYQRHGDIAYGTQTQQRLDVYVPDAAAGPRAMIIFWHGGRWSFGDKSDYRFVGAALAKLGVVSVLPNYRHYPEVKMPGFMDDAASAALWAAAHSRDYAVAPQRIFLMGHSAGAHMAALLALDARYFAAREGRAPPKAGVIGLSGPYDFLPLQEADVQDMFGPAELYPESQPINFVHSGAPPMLLIHGAKDQTVWPKNSRNLASALHARGVPVTLKLYPKLVHADTVAALSLPARYRAPTLADIEAFLAATAPEGSAV
jgi:acetyl esterase/lipase